MLPLKKGKNTGNLQSCPKPKNRKKKHGKILKIIPKNFVRKTDTDYLEKKAQRPQTGTGH